MIGAGEKVKFNMRQFFMICVLLFITMADILMDYVNAGFDPSVFKDTAYWVELALSLFSVVFVTLAARDFFRERELEQNVGVKEAQGKTKAVHSELISRDLMTRFESYVDKINAERKLKAYMDYLRCKKFKARKAKKKDYWQGRVETAGADIQFFKTVGRRIKVSALSWVKYIPVKTSTILANVDTGENDDDDLSGNEGALVGQMLTRKISLIVAMSFAFSTLFFTDSNVGLGIIASTLMKLFRIAASVYTGASDGISFIRHTLQNKMERRLDFIQKFLEKEKNPERA